MGIAVDALVKHDLDTSGIEALAGQLAERLGITIVYGYVDDWTYEREATLDFVVKGYAGENEHEVHLLYWEWYYETVMQVKIHYDDDSRASIVPTPEDEKYWEFELHYRMEDDIYFLSIFKDCYDPGICFGGKWYAFLRPFVNQDEKGWYEQDVLAFRKKVHHFQQLLCAEPIAWYFADSYSEAALLNETAASGTWDDVMACIKKLELSNPVLDMGQWYSQERRYLEKAPILFRDNFSDLMADQKNKMDKA